jgi:O-antigen ligase
MSARGLLFIYSLIFFSSSLASAKFNLLILAVTIPVAAKYLIMGSSDAKDYRTFQVLLLFYGLWVAISGLLHYYALSLLDPLTYISIDKKDAAWGIKTVKDTAALYVSFPLLFYIGIHIVKSLKGDYKILFLLPFLIIPSLAVAFYQGFVDIAFLNNPYFIELKRVSGLDNDSNGFGISLFLLSALCVLAFLISNRKTKKLLFILLFLSLCIGLLLSGSLTGLAGLTLFLITLPWIWQWSNVETPKKNLIVLMIAPLCLALVAGASLIILLTSSHSAYPSAIKRLSSIHADFKEGGIKKILSISGRMDLGINAYKLTRLSVISGWGPGGEQRNLQNIRLRSGSNEYYFLKDNANNHYLQMSSELGLLGAAFNVILHVFPVWMFLRIGGEIRGKDERLAAGIVFSMVCIMMMLFLTGPHTMAVSIQWIFALLLSFLFVTALRYGYTFRPLNQKALINGIVLTVIFSVGTYNNAFGKEGYKARRDASWWPLQYERNCYELELWGDSPARWCKGNAVLQFQTIPSLPEYVAITLTVRHPDAAQKPVTVRYGGKSGTVHEITFKDTPSITVQIPVTDEYIFRYARPDGMIIRYFVLSLDVSRTWIPKEWGINNDQRELGVAVIIPKDLRPS